MSREPRASGYTYAGLFLVTLATVMLQILLTRIFSVTMWYHFAFMAVSIAMFGMTVGAIAVYLRPRYFAPERVRAQLSMSALLFSVSTVVSFVVNLFIPFLTGTGHLLPARAGSVAEGGGGGWAATIAYLGLTYVVISIPFVFSGIGVCLALTRFPRSVSRLYAADLAGAGLGCVLLIYVLRVTDGPTAVLVVAALASAAALVFALDHGGRKLVRAALVSTAALGLFSVVHTVLVHRQAPILRLLWIKGSVQEKPVYERWNSFAYFDVCCEPVTPTEPFGWGLSSTFRPEAGIRQLVLAIDAWALTVMTEFDGDTSGLEHLRYDVTNFAHYLRPDARVLIVGAGGGRDVLSALTFGQREVVGVEINGDLLDAVNGRFGDFTGHLDRDPRVRFVNDEARSYIARQDDRFDLLQVSLIDTFAATAAGAFALTENSLYTIEAWQTFLEHLTPDGIISFSRWYNPAQPAELYRLTALATASLIQFGIEDPRRHVAVVADIAPDSDRTSGVGTLLASRAPFSDRDLEVIRETAGRMKFSVLASPKIWSDATLARIAAGWDLERLAESFPLDISPPTDDRPFFFNMLRLRDLVDRGLGTGVQNQFNLTAVATLGILLLVVTALTVLCVIVPLAMTTERESLRGSGPFFAFFAAIGFGFMFVEISQMQRLIVFLGHPIYGLTVVLFSLLMSSGLGSFLTPDLGSGTSARRASWRLVALLGALVLFGTLTPWVTGSFRGDTTPVRIATAVGLLFPLGLFMGMAFPMGMSLASRRSAA